MVGQLQEAVGQLVICGVICAESDRTGWCIGNLSQGLT